MRRQRTLWADIDRDCAAWAGDMTGKMVADLGCGTGGMVAELAHRVGPSGRTYAIDGTPQMLTETCTYADECGVVDRIATLEAKLESAQDFQLLRDELPPLDLIWAAGFVHHVPDQLAVLRLAGDLLAPGGRLLLAEGGIRPMALPRDVGIGRPGLEARLAAAEAEWFVDMRAELPGAVRAPFGWRAMLSRAGFSDIESRSFLLEVPDPSPELRADLAASYRQRVERAGDRLSDVDRAAWARLLDADGRTYLAERDDLHLLGVRTVHRGTG